MPVSNRPSSQFSIPSRMGCTLTSLQEGPAPTLGPFIYEDNTKCVNKCINKYINKNSNNSDDNNTTEYSENIVVHKHKKIKRQK